MLDIYMYCMMPVGWVLTLVGCSFMYNKISKDVCSTTTSDITSTFIVLVFGLFLSTIAGFIIPFLAICTIFLSVVCITSKLWDKLNIDKIKKIWKTIREV